MINKTLCEHCVFKVLDDTGKQNGCKLNRLDKLPHHEEGLFKVIDTYCSACRNMYWEVADNEDIVKRVYEELQISYDIIIMFHDGDTKSQIETTIESIEKLTIKPRKVTIIMELNIENEYLGKSILPKLDKKYDFNLTVEKENSLKINPIVNKSKASYLLFTNPGEIIDDEVIKSFNESINIELKPKILFVSNAFFLCAKFLYDHFMFDATPFESIIKYVESSTKSKRTDSKPELC